MHAKQQGNTRTHGMPPMRNHTDALCLQSDWNYLPHSNDDLICQFVFFFKVVSSTAQTLTSPAHSRLKVPAADSSACAGQIERMVMSCADGSRQVCGGPHAPVSEVRRWRRRQRARSDKVLPLVFTWLIFLFSLASWYLGSSVVMVNLSLFFS